MSEAAAAPMPEKPSDKLTVQYQGKPRELFMSFLRQNQIMRFVDGPADVISIGINPDIGELILKILLAEKPNTGDQPLIELDENDLTSEDNELILDWAQDHLTYFFMTRFQKMAARGAELEPIAKALQQSKTGSQGSTLETPAVGPSTLSPAD